MLNLSNVSTTNLVEELRQRRGVVSLKNPDDGYLCIIVDHKALEDVEDQQ